MEVFWWLNSKVFWLEEGDKNTKFLHFMANVRKCVNLIGRLRSRALEDIKR